MAEYQRLRSLTEALRVPGNRIRVTRQDSPHVIARLEEPSYATLSEGIGIHALSALYMCQETLGMSTLNRSRMFGQFRESSPSELLGPEDFIDAWLSSREGQAYATFIHGDSIIIVAEAKIMTGATPHSMKDKRVARIEAPNFWEAYRGLNMMLEDKI